LPRQLLASRTNIGAYLGPESYLLDQNVQVLKLLLLSPRLRSWWKRRENEPCDALRNSRDDAPLGGCRSGALGIERPFFVDGKKSVDAADYLIRF
jgi:hypothetical protein